MELLIKIALIIHIATGFTALLIGFIALLTKKGQKAHRISGLIFFYCMLGVAVSAIFISVVKDNLFLLLIGIFSFYQNISGYRAIKNKSLKPTFIDWMILLIGAVNGFYMIYTLNTILIVFGAINCFMVFNDIRIYRKTLIGIEIPKNQWLIKHLGMMIGTYIATFTAFLVVNIHNFKPNWLIWMLPTFIGTPLIAYWRRKLTPNKKLN